MNKKTKNGSIAFYIVVFSSVIFILVTAIIGVFSYNMYKETFYDYSNKMCASINAQAADLVDGDQIEQFVKTLEITEEYKAFSDKLDTLHAHEYVKYLYILVDNGVPGMYTVIYDATVKEKFPGEEYALGRTVPITEYKGADEVMESGMPFDDARFYSDRSDELSYAYAPIFNSKNEVVGFLGTDVDVKPISDLLASYWHSILLTVLLALLIFILADYIILRALFVTSLDVLSDNAYKLSRGDISFYLNDRVLGRNDEVGRVAGAMNTVSSRVRSLINDIGGVLAMIRAGHMGKRADTAGYEGEYLHIIDGFNQTLDFVTMQYDAIPDCIAFLSKDTKDALYVNKSMADLMDKLSISHDNCLDYFVREIHQHHVTSKIAQLFSGEQVRPITENVSFGDLNGTILHYTLALFTDGNEEHDTCIIMMLTDISKLMDSEALLTKRLKQQELMAAISQSFIAAADIEATIDNCLRMTGEFMGISRINVVEKKGGDIHYIYEWIRTNSSARSRNGNTHTIYTWQLDIANKFEKGELTYYATDDYELENVTNQYFFDSLAFLTTPIFVADHFWGVLELSQCDSSIPWTQSDIDLAMLIAGVFSGVISRTYMENDIISAKEAAESASGAKSEFLARMSHEIRTPMNAIMGMAQVTRKSTDIAEVHRGIDKILSSSDHLMSLINDILDLSKIEAGKLEIENKDFILEKMLIRVCSFVAVRVEEKNQSFTVNIENGIPTAFVGDELRITQVITNFLSNAIKFTPENGSIELKVSFVNKDEDASTLMFSVKDSGIGISAEEIERLFTPFEQADGSISRRFGGTGLGLSISKLIAELMGGEVSVTSEMNVGSTFSFTVKLENSKDYEKITVDKNIDISNLKVLVADDSHEILDYFADVLGDRNISVTTVSSGEEAARAAKEQFEQSEPFNMIFLDWRMGGSIDGIETAKLIRSTVQNDPFIALFSLARINMTASERDAAGINIVLQKPLFASTIIDTINMSASYVERDVGLEDEVLDFGGKRILLVEDIEVNREIFEMLLDDVNIKIETAENGMDALGAFKNGHDYYDLIFMDIHMPVMDGYSATRAIREFELGEKRRIPIVAMTANAFKEDIEKCLAVGMNDHIAKPIDVDRLMSVLKRYLLEEKLMIYRDPNVLLDYAAGIARTGGNETVYKKLLRDLDLVQAKKNMQEALGNDDRVKLAQYAHNLAMECANLSLDCLYLKLVGLEKDVLDSNKDLQVIMAEIFDVLDKSVEAVMEKRD